MLIRKAKVTLGGIVGSKWVNRVPMHEVMRLVKKATDPHAVRKPQRQLGGPWISDLIARRRIFSLCEGCRRRYPPVFFRNYNYIVHYDSELTDCDGCSEMKICASLTPGEAPTALRRLQQEKKKCSLIAQRQGTA